MFLDYEWRVTWTKYGIVQNHSDKNEQNMESVWNCSDSNEQNLESIRNCSDIIPEELYDWPVLRFFRSWIRRHKRSLIVSAGLVGVGYVCYKTVKSHYKTSQEKETHTYLLRQAEQRVEAQYVISTLFSHQGKSF